MNAVELIVNGGLGNQLWQAAFGIALEQTIGASVHYRPSYGPHDPFGRSFLLHRYFPALRRFPIASGDAPATVYREKQFAADAATTMREIEAFISNNPRALLEGYWLYDEYWLPHEWLVRDALHIEGEQTNRIGVHVRRSEYGHHGLAAVSYYKDAIAQIRSEVGHLRVAVFTDEPAFCAFEFRDVPDLDVIRGNIADPIADFRSLSLCRHYVLSNSSFATWAAILGAGPQSIIYAPMPQCVFQPELSPPKHWRLVPDAVRRQ